MTIEPFYDRTDLDPAHDRRPSRRTSLEGGLLVVVVLFLMLGNLRGGLIVASAIPLSMLFAFIGMVRSGVSGNLMSLGAIDFGLIVDGAVVMVENVVRRLSREASRREATHARRVIREATTEVRAPGRVRASASS